MASSGASAAKMIVSSTPHGSSHLDQFIIAALRGALSSNTGGYTFGSGGYAFSSTATELGSSSGYTFGSWSGHQPALNHDKLRVGPRPFVHFVAKVASRCNISCTYCYMYEHADQTWRTQPKHMSDDTEQRLISRIGDYLTDYVGPRPLVILHGGEPLLYGAARIDRFATRVGRMSEERGLPVDLALQTNATLIDKAFLDIVARHHIHVGVSMDGPPEIHDKTRPGKRGEGTYDRAAAGLRQLIMAAGDGVSSPAVTAVIDPATDPGNLIRHFIALGVERVDFQLPDYNHDTYPKDLWPPGTFGDWLIRLYENLRHLDPPFRVRSIELLIQLLLGSPYGADMLGRISFGTLVIDTDGSYQAHDALKATFEGAPATGMSVKTDSIRSLETHRLVLAQTDKATAASRTCRACALFDVCGGGLVAHRYSTDRGFDNASVYCTDLVMLIQHVSRSLSEVAVRSQWGGVR